MKYLEIKNYKTSDNWQNMPLLDLKLGDNPKLGDKVPISNLQARTLMTSCLHELTTT